jgi:hypothetical protein
MERHSRHAQPGVLPCTATAWTTQALTSGAWLPQVKARHLWGDTVYTDDSDLVSVLMHMGYFSNNITHPPPQMSEVHAVLDLLAPRDSYPSNFRNSVRSRAWCSKLSTCSYKVSRAAGLAW